MLPQRITGSISSVACIDRSSVGKTMKLELHGNVLPFFPIGNPADTRLSDAKFPGQLGLPTTHPRGRTNSPDRIGSYDRIGAEFSDRLVSISFAVGLVLQRGSV